jgi:hypothetical protein
MKQCTAINSLNITHANSITFQVPKIHAIIFQKSAKRMLSRHL